MFTLRLRCTSVLAAVGTFACVLNAQAALHQWTTIGPTGAEVRALAAAGANVYAATRVNGVLRSIDRGEHWSVAADGLADPNVSALAIDPLAPDTLYAGTARSGVFKSVDGGGRWIAANAGLPTEDTTFSVNALAVDPRQSGIVYAATSQGVYKSTDGGTTWTAAGLAGVSGMRLAVDPNIPDTVYFAGIETSGGTRSGIYKSVDAGAHWTRIREVPLDPYGDIAVGSVYVDAQSRVYVVFASTTAVRSDDGGTTWSTLPVPFPIVKQLATLAIDAADPRTLFLGTYDGGIFRSSDRGQTWTPAATLRTLATDLIAANGVVYAATLAGVFASADAGMTWSAPDLDIRRVATWAVAVDSTAASIVYASAAGAPTKTTDAGQHWTDIGAGIAGAVSRIVVDPQSPSTLYAVTATTVYKSVDAGAHWSPLDPGIPGAYVRSLVVAPTRPSTLYLALDQAAVVKSIDGGATWTIANHGLGDFAPTLLVVDPGDPDIVFAARGRQLYKSTDGAANWQVLSLPAATAFVTGVATAPASSSTVYVALGDYEGVAGGVLKSVDGGTSWSRAQSGLPTDALVASIAVDPSDGQRVYAATTAGVFRSIDAAATWLPLNAGLPDTVVSDVAVDPSGKVLRAAAASGLFEYRFADASASVVRVVEYHHGGLDHYFITANADEIADLDNGVAPGWVRTGLSFNAFAAPSGTTAPVCRFFSTAFAPKSSHFYSPFAAECAKVRSDPQWQLETDDAFDIAVPSANGDCAAELIPVYRLYNAGQGGAPNHRYTSDRDVRARMLAQGWVPEGIGPNAVQMCSPP